MLWSLASAGRLPPIHTSAIPRGRRSIIVLSQANQRARSPQHWLKRVARADRRCCLEAIAPIKSRQESVSGSAVPGSTTTIETITRSAGRGKEQRKGGLGLYRSHYCCLAKSSIQHQHRVHCADSLRSPTLTLVPP